MVLSDNYRYTECTKHCSIGQKLGYLDKCLFTCTSLLKCNTLIRMQSLFILNYSPSDILLSCPAILPLVQIPTKPITDHESRRVSRALVRRVRQRSPGLRRASLRARVIQRAHALRPTHRQKARRRTARVLDAFGAAFGSRSGGRDGVVRGAGSDLRAGRAVGEEGSEEVVGCAGGVDLLRRGRFDCYRCCGAGRGT